MGAHLSVRLQAATKQNFNNLKLFKSDSPYRGALSEAILQLQESGEISRLKTKWWKEKRGGGACSGVS